MSEKLCLQWNDFNENINSAFGKLRSVKEFTDVTIVCEDGQEMEAHKVILASSSPFFEKILQKGKHSHPLIYLKGFQSRDFASILDFLYLGEANVYKEDLDSFLAIAADIKLKGLTGQTSTELLEEQEKPKQEPVPNKPITTSSTCKRGLTPKSKIKLSKVIPNQSATDLQALDKKVKSMMEKGQKMITCGKQTNGTPSRQTSYICKVCGKEDRSSNIRTHIEYNHLDGISVPCGYCDKTFSSMHNLGRHIRQYHK